MRSERKITLERLRSTLERLRSTLKPSGSTSGAPRLLFDGPCHLCQSSVRFIRRRQKKPVFTFLPLQSEEARTLLASCLDTADEQVAQEIAKLLQKAKMEAQTLVLIENGCCYLRSDAALRIAKYLRFPWSLLTALRIIPRPLRDAAYNFVARNRYRWFGRDGEGVGECGALRL